MYIQGLNEAIDLRRMRKNEKASTQRLCKKSDDAFCRDQQCYKIIKIVQSQLGKTAFKIWNYKKKQNDDCRLWGNQQYWYFHKMYYFLEHCIYAIGRIEYYEESICEVVDVSDTVKMWVESTNSIFFVPNLFYFFWKVLLLK